ncbi:aminotransferase DegT [Orenia metallireducens]|uniref:Aminotransferase DegT n=1 Tax=Orenia metallireducens TaxID=1413210 RepID=A0A1C0A633_9FIRM|nr:LegC family aminotransferase [Orenia metallireducens]OCL25573.1 aminotransferase DegT [Orenia metallireducens]
MENKFIGLSVPNLSLDILDNLKECIETGWVSTGGKFITEFEKKMANYVGVNDAVSIQSGTAGLHTALRVLGVDNSDEVIVPTLTFIAAVNPVKYLGANPVFMDCDESLNMNVDKLERFCKEECELRENNLVNKKTGRKIKAIVVVHVFGNMANMEKITNIAKKYKLKVLEDATEALGTYYTEGKYKGKFAGTIGDMGVYSFNANKIITTGGGGMVVSNNQSLLDEVRFLSVQAKTDSLYFVHNEIGYNYRLTNLQAALGVDQIDRLEEFINTKIKNYSYYKEEIEKIEGLELLPFNKGIRANHWFYSIIVNKDKYGIDRDELLTKLNNINIQTRPLWRLIHKQKPYQNSETYEINRADYFEENLINIPCSSNLTTKEVETVIDKLKQFRG